MFSITKEDLTKEKQRLLRKRTRRRILIPCILILCIALCIFAFFRFFTLCTVYGDAMEPQIHSGSTAVVWKTDDIRPGDTVLFTHTSLPYVRYVDAVSEEGYYVTAMKENALDSSNAMGIIAPDDIIGRILFSF